MEKIRVVAPRFRIIRIVLKGLLEMEQRFIVFASGIVHHAKNPASVVVGIVELYGPLRKFDGFNSQLIAML